VTQPQLWVFAGPNGAGKSTLVDRYVRGRIPVVNPDNIARSLPDSLDEASRSLRAGRLALRERSAYLTAQQDFAIETTLTGRSELELMRSAAKEGFKINLVYIGLRDVQHSIARVRERVGRGGHDVPLADLLRRFDRSLRHLPKAMALATRVILIDNSGRRPQFILSREHGRVKFAAQTPPAWVADALAKSSAE